MSISEKLDTIEDNVPRVYAAGGNGEVGTGDGKCVFIVDYDEQRGSNHTAQEVFDCVANGGTAMLRIDGTRCYSLSWCRADSAFFSGVDDEHMLRAYELYESHLFAIPHVELVGAEYVQNYVTERLAEVGGGSDITVDDALSLTSENPVQNKVITQEVSRIYTEISKKQVDGALSVTSQNPVQNKVVTEKIFALGDKTVEHDYRLTALEQNGTGGGGIVVEDDGNGNVTITATAGVSITDDGQGNVTIV